MEERVIEHGSAFVRAHLPIAQIRSSDVTSKCLTNGRRHYGFSTGTRTILPHSVQDPS